MDIEILGNKDTRSGFGEGLSYLGANNPNVVALCADLTGSLKMDDFKAKYPDRFFQVGVAEANMVSIAAVMEVVKTYEQAWPINTSKQPMSSPIIG